MRERLDRAAGLGLDAVALEARAARHPDAAPRAPLHEAADGLQRLGLVRLDEHADASDGQLLHKRGRRRGLSFKSSEKRLELTKKTCADDSRRRREGQAERRTVNDEVG